MNTALGDLDCDGVLDLVTGTGLGGRPGVVVYDGATGADGTLLQSYYAYTPDFAARAGVR